MKRRLSILAVTLLSSVGWQASRQPLDGSLHLDPEGDEAALRGPIRCNPCPVAGVRG